MKPKITFIHGMFLNPKCWEHWIAFFEQRGFQCEAPAWPFHAGDPEFLRKNVPWELGTLGLATVAGFYENHLRRRGEFPILVGHSTGGLIVQRLVAAGLATAGVCIAPVPPNKILPFDRGIWKTLIAGASDDPRQITPSQFHNHFANTLSDPDSRAAYDRYVVPESPQILRDAGGANAMLDVDCPHVPLLFVGAGKDDVVPASVVRKNAAAYVDGRSAQDYVEFPDRSHFMITEEGWEEVASRTADWLDAHLAVGVS